MPVPWQPKRAACPALPFGERAYPTLPATCDSVVSSATPPKRGDQFRHIAALPVRRAPRRSVIVQFALAGSIDLSPLTMSARNLSDAAFCPLLRLPSAV